MSDANADEVTKMLNQKIDKIVVNVVPEIFSRGDAKLTFKRSEFMLELNILGVAVGAVGRK